MIGSLRIFWQRLRQFSGDDAYERYLAHYAMHTGHVCEHHDEAPLTKKEFYRQWQDEKWQGIKRCC